MTQNATQAFWNPVPGDGSFVNEAQHENPIGPHEIALPTPVKSDYRKLAFGLTLAVDQ
jgi:hypothetical protein